MKKRASMNTHNKKILIIPDVHGRQFWKKAVGSGDYDKVVFLGDYLDPYPDERIGELTAQHNFEDILPTRWCCSWAITTFTTCRPTITTSVRVDDTMSSIATTTGSCSHKKTASGWPVRRQ